MIEESSFVIWYFVCAKFNVGLGNYSSGLLRFVIIVTACLNVELPRSCNKGVLDAFHAIKCAKYEVVIVGV